MLQDLFSSGIKEISSKVYRKYYVENRQQTRQVAKPAVTPINNLAAVAVVSQVMQATMELQGQTWLMQAVCLVASWVSRQWAQYLPPPFCFHLQLGKLEDCDNRKCKNRYHFSSWGLNDKINQPQARMKRNGINNSRNGLFRNCLQYACSIMLSEAWNKTTRAKLFWREQDTTI